MKKILKRLVSLMLAAAIVLLAVPAQVQAEEKKPYMKRLNVKWDLKPDKEVTFQSYWTGIGYLDGTVKLTDYKITDAKKKGYKKLTFIYDGTSLKKTPSNQQIHAIVNSPDFQKYWDVGGAMQYAVVDYTTGRSLEADNNRNVTVKYKELAGTTDTTYNDSDGCWIMGSRWREKVTVTYPDDYKGLCIVVGGTTKERIVDKGFDNDFYNGNGKFGKTSMVSSKNNKVAHVMRVK